MCSYICAKGQFNERNGFQIFLKTLKIWWKKNPAPVQNFKLEDDKELDDIKWHLINDHHTQLNLQV
jgi:outer membrane biogenesis lipoprotein LolB